MNATSENSLTQPGQNPLATILFIFGSLHVYSLVKSNKINRPVLKMVIKIFRPVLRTILLVFLFSTTFVEAIKILESSLH